MFHLNPNPRPPRWVGAGDARPRGGLLGDGHDAGDTLVRRRVDLLQERHRLEVLAAAELVGDPLARLARVVEVEHRRDGVDAKPVDVELLEPEQGVRDQEVAHLGAPEVEDVGAPVELLAPPRVGVLVEGGAVEPGQCPGVLREVRGDPVDDDADAGLVQRVDEVAELVRVTEAGGRREVRGHLVAPGPAEGVLGHRQHHPKQLRELKTRYIRIRFCPEVKLTARLRTRSTARHNSPQFSGLRRSTANQSSSLPRYTIFLSGNETRSRRKPI